MGGGDVAEGDRRRPPGIPASIDHQVLGLDEGGPRFVRRDGDVGYFTPAGGGAERAVYLPGAPSFARMADEALAAGDAAGRAAAPQAGPRVADAGAFTSFLGPQDTAPVATDANPPPASVAPGTGPLANPQRWSPQGPTPVTGQPPAPPARSMTEQAQREIARTRQSGAFTSSVGPSPQATAERMFTTPHNEPNPEAYVGETFIDPYGGGVAAPAPQRGQGRGRAPATEAELVDPNAQLIDELISRPEGERLVPYDFRPESIGERTARGIDEARRLQQERSELAGGAAAEREDLLHDRQARQAQMEAERQDAMRHARQRLEGAIQRMNEAQIDPNRYFAQRGGAAGRIGAAISVALGAVGGALMGTGGNEALAIIQSEIERDMDAQRQNQAHSRAGVQAAQSFLDITRREFSDQQAAEDAAQALMWEQVSQRVGQHVAALQGEEARQRAQALQLQADQQAQAAAARAAEQEFRTEMELRRLRADTMRAEARAAREQRRLMGGGARGSLPMPPSWTQGPEAWAGLTRSQQQSAIGRLGTRAPSGSGGPSADLRQRFTAASDAVSQLMQAVPESGDIPGVGAIDSRRGTGWMQSDAGRRIRLLGENAVRRYLRMESGAAISEDEMSQEMQIRGMHEGASEAQFREGMAQLRRDLQARAQALGLSGPEGRPQEAPLPPGVRRR